jgi:hypothetical protein
MAIIHDLKRLAVSMLLLGAIPLRSQETPYDFALKIRAGATSGSLAKANENKRQIGFSVGAMRPWRNGHLTADLTFDLFNGRNTDQTKFSGPIYFDPTGSMDGASSVTSVDGEALYLDPWNSIDMRKHIVSGFGIRAGYTAKLPISWMEGWSWQAGLSLDRMQTKYEVAQTLVPVYGPDYTFAGSFWNYDPDNPDYYEGLAEVHTATKITPGLYAGLSVPLTKEYRLEMNLRSVGYAQVDYHPFTYTGTKARYTESTKYGFVIEFSFGMKL